MQYVEQADINTHMLPSYGMRLSIQGHSLKRPHMELLCLALGTCNKLQGKNHQTREGIGVYTPLLLQVSKTYPSQPASAFRHLVAQSTLCMLPLWIRKTQQLYLNCRTHKIFTVSRLGAGHSHALTET